MLRRTTVVILEAILVIGSKVLAADHPVLMLHGSTLATPLLLLKAVLLRPEFQCGSSVPKVSQKQVDSKQVYCKSLF